MVPSRALGATVLLALLNVPSSAEASHVVQSATVSFMRIGEVIVRALEPEGHLPQLVLAEASTGRLLLVTDVGTSDPEANESYVIHRDWGPSSPRVRFLVRRVTGVPNPLVLAVAIRPGGSDCRYAASIVGAFDGELKNLTPSRLWTNAEGGFAVGNLGGDRGFGLIRWNFIWGNEAHSGPHRYEVSIFRFDPTGLRFKLLQNTTSSRKYANGEEFLTELGFHCRNLLRDFPDLGC
jgi:hypothetical protein